LPVENQPAPKNYFDTKKTWRGEREYGQNVSQKLTKTTIVTPKIDC
jgi:hypothetical protein